MLQKEIKNNKVEIPTKHYLDLYEQINPESRAKTLGISYEDHKFELKVLNNTYYISWPEAEVTSPDENACFITNPSAKILFLRYLIQGHKYPTSGNFKTFRELPSCEIYLTTYNGRCIARLAWKYHGKADVFCKACESIGGVRVDHGDDGYEFSFIDDYKIRFYLYEGDEEFPPNAQIEFSDNFALGFSSEDDVVVPELIITAISDRMKHI